MANQELTFSYKQGHLMDVAFSKRLIDIKRRIESKFNSSHWEELGLLTGMSDVIDRHHRLLRSLSFGDEDYAENILDVLRTMTSNDPEVVNVINEFMDDNFPDDTTFISSKPSVRKITFSPNVFQVPDGPVEPSLVSVMMPFRKEFGSVYAAIGRACDIAKLRCQRADDIWESSTFMQDVFSLIYRSRAVVVDFTGKNPNVMYETGIAHTLGKDVVPITQSLDDIPSDMNHHRALKYLPNGEGLAHLQAELAKRLQYVAAPILGRMVKTADDLEIPF